LSNFYSIRRPILDISSIEQANLKKDQHLGMAGTAVVMTWILKPFPWLITESKKFCSSGQRLAKKKR